MASAAAVATDISRSPIPQHEVHEGLDTVGGIGRADHFRSPDSESDEDVVARSRRPGLTNGTSHGALDMEDDDMAEDGIDAALFGDVSEDEAPAAAPRILDDEELDSGDDDGRVPRGQMDEDMRQDDGVIQDVESMEVDLPRVPLPEPSDGELYLLKIPPFLAIEHVRFDQPRFVAPKTDHHTKGDTPSSTFSAYNTAMTTIRWRRSPSDSTKLQSNARVVRWSDGSLTLQFAAKPATHYPVAANPLASPQTNPLKPTPTSQPVRKRGQTNNAIQDSFTYLAAAQEQAGLLRITKKITAGLKVQSATDAAAEALERLQNSLAAASGSHGDQPHNDSGINMVHITEDPELAKRKAEIAEKEKSKASKRREAQEMRERERNGRVMGGRRSYGNGLTLGSLEDDGQGLTRLPGVGGSKNKKKAKRSDRRGEIYSDDESDYDRRGKTKEDEYDAEDDFLAPSDEEEEEPAGESESDAVDEPAAKARPKPTRAVTPKRSLDDAEGDLDEDAARKVPANGSPAIRTKKRRVIDDEDDDEDE